MSTQDTDVSVLVESACRLARDAQQAVAIYLDEHGWLDYEVLGALNGERVLEIIAPCASRPRSW